MSISAQLAQARLEYFRNDPSKPVNAPESLGKIGGEGAETSANSLSFHEVLAAINPLNHIPIVSDLFAADTPGASSSSTALSRVVGVAGSALLGGPVGFIASIASLAFEGATGQTPARAVVARLTQEPNESTPMLASAEATVAAPVTAVEAKPAQQVAVQPAPLMSPQAALAMSSLDLETQTALQRASLPDIRDEPRDAAASKPAKPISVPARANEILELYGASTPSAHASYRQAQLRPYLNDVTVSRVL